jgi:hypothetical protein
MVCSGISVTDRERTWSTTRGEFDAMKRWILVSSVVLISALGVSVPAGAQASTAAGGELTSGKPVTVTISKVGQEFKYTFAATANKNVTFDVTKFHFTDNGSAGAFYLYFYEPGSSTADTDSYFDANGYYNFTPPQTGTWSVALIPYGASVGSLTLTFANDVPTQALKSGTPVSTTIKYEGQESGYTFAATANKSVTLHVTKFDFTDNGSAGAFYLYFYEPGSSSYYTDCYFDANGTCTVKAPVGGTWSIALVPYGASVGSLTIKLT